MAELEWIFLQNAAVAAALLGDEEAQTLREKLLKESSINGNPVRDFSRKTEQNASAEAAESESEENSQLVRALSETRAEGEDDPAIFSENAARGARADVSDSAGADGMRILETAAERQDKLRASEEELNGGQSFFQGTDEPTGAQLLLEELGQEGLWNGETTLRAQRLAQTQERRFEVPSPDAETEARRAGQDARFQRDGESADLERQSSSAGREQWNAETENDGAAERLEAGQARAAYTGGFSNGNADGGSASSALLGSRNAEIARQSSMAEISRFFERDARRYGS